MTKNATIERARSDIVRLCHAGLDASSLRIELLKRLESVIPYSSVNFGTVDPATLLHTSAVTVGIPEETRAAFLNNELLEEDFNKFVHLSRRRAGVSTLYDATGGKPEASRRYRTLLAPLGFGNELRAVLKAGSSVWGVMCLHRDGSGFTTSEVTFIKRLTSHLAEGLRTALLLGNLQDAEAAEDGPGLLVVSDDLTLVTISRAAERWLAELGDGSLFDELPIPVRAVVLRLLALERAGDTKQAHMPRVRIRSRSGRWLVLHASRFSVPGALNQNAVILQVAHPVEIAPLILHSYGLTAREAEVAGLALRGLSTDEIARELVISPLTVQQHMKAVFEKTGVNSRRALVGRIFAEQYLPRLAGGAVIAPNGWFTE